MPFSRETLSNLIFNKHVTVFNNGSISLSSKKNRKIHENKKW